MAGKSDEKEQGQRRSTIHKQAELETELLY